MSTSCVEGEVARLRSGHFGSGGYGPPPVSESGLWRHVACDGNRLASLMRGPWSWKPQIGGGQLVARSPLDLGPSGAHLRAHLLVFARVPC